MMREKDPSDTAKTSVCHWLSMRLGLRKDTRVCQAPAASSLRNRKCSWVDEYRRPSSSTSLSSATTVSRYSFFCREQVRGAGLGRHSWVRGRANGERAGPEEGLG